MFDEMNDLSKTTVVILAGGFGTRLKPILKGYPKVLASIHQRPFLFYLFDLIAAHGGCRVVLCTGYRADLVERVVMDTYEGPLQVSYSMETTPLGTGGALRLCLDKVESEYFLALNGDSFVRCDLNAYADWCLERDARAGLFLTEVAETSRYGRVDIDGEGRVSQFLEKTTSRGKGFINAGIYFFRKDALIKYPLYEPISLEKEIFPELIQSGLHGYLGSGEFIDIGTPESYERAGRFFHP